MTTIKRLTLNMIFDILNKLSIKIMNSKFQARNWTYNIGNERNYRKPKSLVHF